MPIHEGRFFLKKGKKANLEYLSKSQQIPFYFLMEGVNQGLMGLRGRIGQLTKGRR